MQVSVQYHCSEFFDGSLEICSRETRFLEGMVPGSPYDVWCYLLHCTNGFTPWTSSCRQDDLNFFLFLEVEWYITGYGSSVMVGVSF